MTYFSYRRLRILVLQASILSRFIKEEQMRRVPNRARLRDLKRTRLSLADRISGHLRFAAIA
ncbi:MAG: hypothetical protein AB7I36_16760 [Rhodospirillaceae bacterium]